MIMRSVRKKIRAGIESILLIAGGVALGSLIENNVNLLITGQHQLQATTYTNVGKTAAQEGTLKVDVYNLSSGNGVHYDAKGLEEYLNRAFESLGIGLDVNYNSIDIQSDEKLKETSSSAREESLDEITYDKVGAYLKAIEASLVDKPANRNAIVIIADFKDSKRNIIGLSFNFNEFVSVGYPSYVLIDGVYNGTATGQKKTYRIMTHEVGHSLGLHHSTLPDVMGYPGYVFDKIIENFPQFAFGPESKYGWRIIKEKFEKDATKKEGSKPKTLGSQPSAPMFLTNFKAYEFYKKHGYPRKPY